MPRGPCHPPPTHQLHRQRIQGTRCSERGSRPQRQSPVTWGRTMLFAGAQFLVPSGLRAGQARLGEPGNHFVFGKADEQEQNENQLCSSLGPGLTFSGCPTRLPVLTIKCSAMTTFSVSSPQLLLRVPPGCMFKGPAVHIAHSPELLHRQPTRCVPESLPSGARTGQWLLQRCLLCGVGWMEGVRGCGQRDKKRRCGLRAGGEGAGREA